ncbi:MAG: hypothetical protein HC897_14930 [Thermoanaerobaculia bacterium]|nr:hypothetical protein [Thermoanaerobaculia bacterium]
MNDPHRTTARLCALFAAGCLAFNPPLLELFSSERMVAGIPVLYVYLFVAWSVLIVLIALALRRQD